eukprot:3237055-Rhodomonas_salina.1
MAALQRLKLGNVQSLVKNVLEDRFEEVGGDWLNECLLALSPSGYAAVAKGSKISWKQFGSGLKDVHTHPIAPPSLLEMHTSAVILRCLANRVRAYDSLRFHLIVRWAGAAGGGVQVRASEALQPARPPARLA